MRPLVYYIEGIVKFYLTTRLHSSRMRTTRLLTVSPSMHCSGGYLVPGGMLCPGGSQHALRQTLPLVNRMTDREV